MERTPYQRYEEAFKLEVLAYYYGHGLDRKSTLEKYGIDHSCLRDWQSRYPDEKKVVTLLSKYEEAMKSSYKQLPRDRARAQSEYERLQRELDAERLRSAAYSEMIDIAEREYEVRIRKKRGARQ